MRTLRTALLLLATAAACARPPAPTTPTPQPPAGQPPEEPTAQQPAPRTLPSLDPDLEGVAVGTHGAVSSAEGHASRVGLQILKRGGNAVDAAIAVQFALAVTHPTAGNLGGGGFLIIRMADGRVSAIDYREMAPGAASSDMYLDEKGEVTRESLVGPRAAGIPGTVAGMALAHERYGTLPWAKLLLPAIELAAEGHAIDEQHAQDLKRGVERIREAGYEESAKLYLAEDGTLLPAGAVWKQPLLAATLQRIADHGPRAFYEGELAETMAAGVQELGGLWTAEDLARYRAVEREPVRFEYRGHEVISMPPPSAGGVVLRQVLGASELLKMASHPWRSPEANHLYIEALRRAYADRNYLLGDPDFAEVPTDTLTSMAYIEMRMGDIDPEKPTPSDEIKGGDPLRGESRETTHYSVVDEAGNAVANTTTLNTGFGARVTIPGTGVLLNNEMDDFAAKPGEPNVYGLVQGERNRIQPYKRMLSSMTPTIVAKDGELRAVLGTPGGPTITTTVIQLVRALVDYGVPLPEAVAAPRIHHQWKPDRVIVEPDIEPELEAGLKAIGHEVIHSRWGRIGHANCVEVDPQTRGFRAVADVARRGGEAVAY
ncbi:MAG: gamma-glutamyltransferase [Myxococcales bacterium]|jgi:gamma-glutamyltranspeptidase/glutathione hydrolase